MNKFDHTDKFRCACGAELTDPRTFTCGTEFVRYSEGGVDARMYRLYRSDLCYGLEIKELTEKKDKYLKLLTQLASEINKIDLSPCGGGSCVVATDSEDKLDYIKRLLNNVHN